MAQTLDGIVPGLPGGGAINHEGARRALRLLEQVTLGAAQPRGPKPEARRNPKVETAMKAHRPFPTPLENNP